MDTRTNCVIAPPDTHLGSSVRLEVLVLDGDFRHGDRDAWTADQFNAAIVKAREGKRPLLVGSLVVQMNNHGVAVIDDVSFTDNSSWIRCRKFRIGVRIMPAGSHFGERIQEAVSESFVVKDHRGELYEKHYPPLLSDNIWRLKNIGKDGPIVKRLESEGIRNVQEFLTLNTIDPAKLRAFHVKQLATQAYKLWDKLEEVTNEMPLAATKCLNPLSNSGRRPSDSQESIISSGSQNAKYLDYTGTATSSAAAAMSTNSSNTSGSAAAAPTNDDMFWTPSIPPDDQFGWQNSTGCWD
nr:unnamed protein product [Digitaria exilis]